MEVSGSGKDCVHEEEKSSDSEGLITFKELDHSDIRNNADRDEGNEILCEQSINEIKDYLIFSILSMLFCQSCCGFAAIVTSLSCRNAKKAGNYYKAKAKSKSSLVLVISTVLSGLFLNILLIIYHFAQIKQIFI
ncbi:DgyrCDS3251 [Dimorphilus gyrociliatus]|uniref:DgyrCDS3251 n=1 Tax=Dimorphilus gyrociliatus TaxID=2664684 RepID=A0A7I8VFP1_9ANNE|nr:DgyrCDS3251 [Dimorphilus gyrociliatus]